MKKNLKILTLIIVFTLPIFLLAFEYMDDADYKQLRGSERNAYLVELEDEMASMQRRRADAMAESEELRQQIANMRNQLDIVDAEVAAAMERLGITEDDLALLHSKLQHYREQLTNWERMNDDELWQNARAVAQLREDFDATRQDRLARLPEFHRDIDDVNRRLTLVEQSLERTRRTRGYWEESYTVQRGDTWLSIAGNDRIREGIIRRANREARRAHNEPGTFHAGHLPTLSEGLNIIIPHGQPTQWRVFRGESLWRIASYPEVYGTGTQWPRIYRANSDQIRDPNLIFPNQVFVIPRDEN